MLSPGLSVLSSVLEMFGVLLMANAYFKVGEEGIRKLKRCFLGFISALYRGNKGDNLADAADTARHESKLTTLQGLAFISLGFLIQVGNSIYTLFQSP